MISGLVVFSVTSLALYNSARRARTKLSQTSEKLAVSESELSSIRGLSYQLQKESRLLMSFIREFPQIANQLGSEANPRELPGLLLHIIVRCYNPWQAVVLLRRQRIKNRAFAAPPPRCSGRRSFWTGYRAWSGGCKFVKVSSEPRLNLQNS